jgi:ABC-type phosphate/phosphonate transport system permease subunit
VAFIIILLLVTVALIDWLSARVRNRLIGTREGVVRQ